MRVDGLVNESRLLLAREDERHVERKRRHDADGDARGLDSQDAVDARILEEARELLAHRLREFRVNLVIEERVDLEHIARQHDAVLLDSLFQQFHV